MQNLIGLLQGTGYFDEAAITKITSTLKVESVKKGTTLIRDGQYFNKVIFLSEGYIRTYQLHDGRERTMSFGKPLQFVGSLIGFTTGLAADEYMETITPAEIIIIDSERLDYLKCEIPQIAFLTNDSLKHMLECKENRIRDFISKTAKERYRSFSTSYPELMKVVSINHLSSFLGVAPETISRIRSEVIF